jgi:hypothetical protein
MVVQFVIKDLHVNVCFCVGLKNQGMISPIALHNTHQKIKTLCTNNTLLRQYDVLVEYQP